MELYGIYFASLALFNAALAYHRSQKSQVEKSEEETLALPKDGASKEEAKRFKTTYFGVYVLVMAADWLQVSEQSSETLARSSAMRLT